MANLNDQQIDQIARGLVNRLIGGKASGSSAPEIPLSDGIFETIDAAVDAAWAAQKSFMEISLEKRGEIIANIRKWMLEYAEELARDAWEETGLGRFEDKIQKNILVTKKTPGPEDLQTGAWSGDRGLTIYERAPYGVIGAITPTTNPTSTIICNTIGMLSAGNSVVFNVHPNARMVSSKNIQLINRAIQQAGGPPNLVTACANPTVESAQELMRHKRVRLLVVTGGAGVVKAAMTSGKRAICAGPGNPPVVVDETADLEAAARDIVKGASFDNNIICVDEKEVFVVREVADALVRNMKKHRAVVLTPVERQKLDRVIFTKTNGPGKPGVINRELIGKNAGVILAKIGIRAGDDVRLVVVEVDADHPLVWTEQMMPVLPVVRVKSAAEGIELAVKAEHGFGHTASMFSRNIDNLSKMAREMNCSIFVKNGPNLAGLGFGGEGFTSFTIASPTGEGLTRPVSFTRERRCVLVDHFRIV
ncbi:MAG: aldehyde dehydrogenase EutE [Calditrichia bacterium]